MSQQKSTIVHTLDEHADHYTTEKNQMTMYVNETFIEHYDHFATGQWFSPGIYVSSTNKTECHEITEILLKVALNTINHTNPSIINVYHFSKMAMMRYENKISFPVDY